MIVVIGSGLFGSTIAEALRQHGHDDVVVLDDQRFGAGSTPAACLMKPSWFSGLGRDVYDPALELLANQYGVVEITFKTGPVSHKVMWCDPHRILVGPDEYAHVGRIETKGKKHILHVRKEDMFGGIAVKTYEADTVIVAAGVWSSGLVPLAERLVGYAGAAFLWKYETIDQPFIKPWAPYKQLVAFDRGDGVWVGDGTTILEKNWTKDRMIKSQERCQKAVGFETVPQVLYGIRPYTRVKPCLLKEVRKGVWVATGGAKNGTVAAAWCAHQLRERLS